MHIILTYFEFFWHLLRRVSQVIGTRKTISLFSYVGHYSSYLFERERKISKAQLLLPGARKLIKKDCEQVINQNFSHVGESIGEILSINRIFSLENMHLPRNEPSIPGFTYEGFTGARSMVGKGGIALSGHIGCIELLAAYHVQRGIPLHVVARVPNYPSAVKTLDKLRKSYGIVTIWRDHAASLRELSVSLKSGVVIAALIDQDIDLDNKFSSFFGLEAAYPMAPIKLAIRYKLPIYTSFIYRLRRLKHHIWTKELPYDPEDSDVEQKILNEYNNRLEKVVAAYPEQWIWWHRRWRRRPDTKEPRSTNEYLSWLDQMR